MKALEERLEDRKKEYEEIIKAEHLVESYLKKIIPLFPDGTRVTGNISSDNTFIYFSMDSVEEFEENVISKISELFDIDWRRDVREEKVLHSTDFVIADEDFRLFIEVTSKPTETCRIIAVPTGKMKTVRKWVDVREQEVEYVVECSDD